ncbi:MAG: hypothetical protein QGG33_09765 [Candidatus Krumholzibacteria bacterium]|nr:hypothetical protein [Candidatus Krumholzibacteria bacterium]
MERNLIALLILSACLVLLWMARDNRISMAGLKEGQVLSGFSTQCLYLDASGKVMGVRFRDLRTDFLLDCFEVQSVPQGFFWVKTIPWTDQGEAHACEHLLLGKGLRGRAVSALEDMSLSSSSAWTSQLSTVYHFNTLGGNEAFYEQLETRLDALLNPDFTDEEIRREVAHLAVAEDPESGDLYLEEKGTVFTEMVSSFEGPGYPLWRKMGDDLYGKDHPLANSAGGHPDSMRNMVPEDMWQFHRDYYRPSGMGLIASLPESIGIEEFLENFAGILQRTAPEAGTGETPGLGNFDLPAPSPARDKDLSFVKYGSDHASDKSSLSLFWPAGLQLDSTDELWMVVFLQSIASGPGSPLYSVFLDSRSREMELGASYVSGYLSEPPMPYVSFNMGGIESARLDEEALGEVRRLILREIRKVHGLKNGSPELEAFNHRADSHLQSMRKSADKILNSPPMFGFRRSGQAGRWQDLVRELEAVPGFRKSLVFRESYEEAERRLQSGENLWRASIESWGLLESMPRGIAVQPDPEPLIRSREERDRRMTEALDGFKEQWSMEDGQETLRRFRDDFDNKTAELDSIAGGDEIPGFLGNPPLSLDPELDYRLEQLQGGVELFAASFENMSSARLSISFRLDTLEDRFLVCLPMLPDLLSDSGLRMDGEWIDAESMRDRIRRELLSFSSHYDLQPLTGRNELRLSASAANRGESEALLRWMKAALLSPWIAEENLPRIRDLVSQNLDYRRNRMKGSEESWVNNPANAWLYQDDPVFLSAGSFLTQTHHLYRLGWMLEDAEPGSLDYLQSLAHEGQMLEREGLRDLLSKGQQGQREELRLGLLACLDEIPDKGLRGDWFYLCAQTTEDLQMPSSDALSLLRQSLHQVLRAGNARMTLCANTGFQEELRSGIEDLLLALPLESLPSVSRKGSRPLLASLLERQQLEEEPMTLGLLNRNTRNGTLVFSAQSSEVWDPDPESILDCLALRSYGGGGGHGLFMRTWAAGLAYSNGPGYSSQSGRIRYYAERCPDVAQTLRFVRDEIASAEVDERKAEYAVAGVFGSSRAASSYEGRTASMASDLVDGFSPERIRAYREEVLSVHKRADLPGQLQSRLHRVYGRVLPGLTSEARRGQFFVLGPEEQFLKLETWLEECGEPVRIPRLWPRDFWIPGEVYPVTTR